MSEADPPRRSLPYATARARVPASERQSPFAFASVLVGIFSVAWQVPAFFKLDVLPVAYSGRIHVALSSSLLSAVLAGAAYQHRPRRHHLSHVAAVLAGVAVLLSTAAPLPF